METIKMGKRGTIVMPAKLRKQFGLEDGSLMVIEANEGEIRLRPAVTVNLRFIRPERTRLLLFDQRDDSGSLG